MVKKLLLTSCVLLGACSISNIDAEFNAKIKACETIEDDSTKLECIKSVEYTSDDSEENRHFDACIDIDNEEFRMKCLDNIKTSAEVVSN